MSCVLYMDSTALRRFECIMESSTHRSNDDDDDDDDTNGPPKVFCWTDVSQHLLQQLEATRLVERIGLDHIFVTLHDAVQFCRQQQQQQNHDGCRERMKHENDVTDNLSQPVHG
jgi:hypothetical protein